MYVKNVRKAIQTLSDNEFEEFIDKLRTVLRFKFSSNVKPSELKKRVKQFANGQDPSIHSFEAYLLTFEQLYKNGALEALLYGRTTATTTWRDVLLKVTEDQPLSSITPIDINDEDIIIEIKSAFTNTMMYCANEDKNKFKRNLHDFNRFLTIQKEEES